MTVFAQTQDHDVELERQDALILQRGSISISELAAHPVEAL